MNNDNVNKITIFLNLIILFLIFFYLINHFFFSKTLVIENKKVEGVVYNTPEQSSQRKSLSLINVNLPELPNMNFSNSIIKAVSKQKNESEEKETSK